MQSNAELQNELSVAVAEITELKEILNDVSVPSTLI